MATPAGLDIAHMHPDPVRPSDGHTPTTPRPTMSPSQSRADDASQDDSGPKTPTRHSFAGLAGQQRLPDEPITPARQTTRDNDPTEPPNTGDSHPSPDSQKSEEMADVEMGDAEDDGSDNDSVTSDSQRPLKKKKGQRFFCTDYPPCMLSFTRSEHLARHIRKHTGERPFQCHCSRRFSRMDNLRQHAQTVHCNEDIPGDSLAATSTRYQRQIRTDRIRASGGRSRTNTMGSTGGPSRGHSRNVSTSSIGSTTSSIGAPEESRKRPLPLAMANDPSARAHLSLETFSANTGQYPYYNQSPTGYSTPTSTTFSAGTGSPRFGSGMASPASTISRSSFYNGARRGRRLSVPSAQLPLQTAIGSSYPPPYFGAPMQTPNMAPFSPSSGVFASPTGSVYSHSRRDSESELEYRRRTWHPGTWPTYAQRPATSGLSYHQTPDDHRPAASDQRAATQVTRLPGIESFDQAARQQPSPMVSAASPRPVSSGRHLDAALPQSMGRLDIAAANAPVEGHWQVAHPQAAGPPQAYYAQQPHPAPGFASHPAQQQPRPPIPEPTTPRRAKRQGWYGGPVEAHHGALPPQAPQQQQQHQQPSMPNSYPQPAYSTHRPSPEDSGSSDGIPTPSAAQGGEYHPMIVNSAGMPEPAYAPHGPVVPDEPHQHAQYKQRYQHHPPLAAPPQTYALQAGHDPRLAGPPAATAYPTAAGPSNHDMGRLEALVAVATSENRAADRS